MRSSFFPESVREKAADVAAVEAGKVAADIGAGTGFVSEELLRRGLKVIAVDESETMLETMRKKFGTGGTIEYRVGESEHLPLNDESVDYVFANMYLHHVEHPAAAIKEMTRVLKPNGKIVITDLDEHNFEFLRTEQHDRWMGFKREDVRRWFTEAGLKDVMTDCVGDDCCADSTTSNDSAKVSIFVATGVK
jgi:ubiquinone/menaquinone biosynthesis C-methylase UbiE